MDSKTHSMKALGLAAALALAALLAAQPAHAGRSCEARKPTVQSIERGLTLAQRTLESLEAEHARSGTQVVVLARAGQDLSRYGVRWSHLGFAYRTPEGAWRVLHKLNQCGTAEASIYRQGLGEFFLDDPWRHEAAWATPTPQAQAALLALLRDDRRALALHHKPYSIVSYAWAQRYQQSNQWLIETWALAAEPQAVGTAGPVTDGRRRAQAWLMFKAYQPATLRIGALTRLGGRLSAANVAFDDHPADKRFSDRIETVTADSVFTWLARTGLGGPPKTIVLDRL